MFMERQASESKIIKTNMSEQIINETPLWNSIQPGRSCILESYKSLSLPTDSYEPTFWDDLEQGQGEAIQDWVEAGRRLM